MTQKIAATCLIQMSPQPETSKQQNYMQSMHFETKRNNKTLELKAKMSSIRCFVDFANVFGQSVRYIPQSLGYSAQRSLYPHTDQGAAAK